MLARSLSSSVLRWPDAGAVLGAAREWAQAVASERAEVVRVGCIGSCARGDWGIGSDLDLLVLVERSDAPFIDRAAQWDTTSLPVPTDEWVYTLDEWDGLGERGSRFHREALACVVWLLER